MSLLTSLVSHWATDEASGSRADSHGSNTLSDISTVGSAAGKIGTAADFERDNSEALSCSSNSTLQTGDIDFSLALWVQLETKAGGGSDYAALGKGDGSSGEYFVQYRNATGQDRFSFRVFGGSGYGSEGAVLANTLGSPSAGTWYFIVAWHDASANTVNIQVNDGGVDSSSHSAGVYVGTGDFALSWPTFSNHWDGLVDEVGFWKRVLTSGERTQLYNGGAGLAYSAFGGGGATPMPVFMHHYREMGIAA